MGKVVRVLLAIYVAYVLVVVLLLMPAVNFMAPRYVEENYGRELRTDLILFNPFTFNAEIRGASLSEPDGSAFAGVDRANVDLSLASLTRPGVVLDGVGVRGLRLQLRRTDTDTYNFSDLLPPPSEDTAEASETTIPAITIDLLVFTAERIDISDEARDEPFQTHYDGIDIAVTDLSTVIEEGKPYRVLARDESGGELEWSGTVSIPQARSEGRLRVSDLSLVPLWRFAEPWLHFELRRGLLNVAGDYTVSWGDGLDYQVDNGRVSLLSLDIAPQAPDSLADTAVVMDQLEVAGISVNGAGQRVHISGVTVDGLNVAGWSEGEQVSLLHLFATDKLPATSPEPAADDDTPAWSASLDDFALQNSYVSWRSEYTDPPTVVLSPLTASASNIAWPPRDDSPLSLSLAVNDTTQLQISGALNLDSGAGEFSYQLQTLPLPWFNPNLPKALKATLTDGQLDVTGALSLAEFMPVLVEVDGAVTNFAGKIEGAEDAITRWDSVRWEALEVDLSERTVFMRKLLIHNYEGRVHIMKDGSINASKVWQEELGDRAEEIAHDLELDRPWQVNIPEILVTESAIDFMDESLPIPFRTVIGDVNGEITDISSAPGSNTSVDIKGSVDGYAPVTLNGTAAPFDEPPGLNLQLVFTGVDMVLLTPYSGTYAGREIERGLLNLDLAYSLDNNHLEGDNKILIDQLKLGEAVDSDKAVDLPLDLALALLTDMSGVIDLQIPVEGDVDNPEFALGSVIAGAVMNLITKAVTAPFALLGSLVGTEDDLQRVGIPSGSAELNDASKKKLGILYEALSQRPGLTLVISGQLNLDPDTRALQKAALEQELLDNGLSAQALAERNADYLQAVEKKYAALGADVGETSFNQRYEAVLASINISAEQLRQLTQARAVASKDYLVNELGMPADRAVIEQSAELDMEAQVFSGVVLDLEP
ncbi:DUF748 domain-containing protein [Pseudohalioglobus sediminis]|uniref:DUF748 domain-containing protein n=1 Tax=Pseudohalioglobus sediminis TaxID=2606449 RepID=A0A5B0X6C8_9GAMM|nr:DUF748 domain-containing protein [Pseudohalioglobus sediminis]KAA1194235.1 DUF748 domain-containing protein [Pseudohalioglobus sediminis]